MSTSFLIDTDTLIYLIRGMRLASARTSQETQRFRLACQIHDRCKERQEAGDLVGVSAITVAELEFGARRCGDYEREAEAVRKVLTPFTVFDFDSTAAAVMYGKVRQALESAGATIGAMDLLIAGHAKGLGATLVTNNLAHFSRVPGLKCENWCT